MEIIVYVLMLFILLDCVFKLSMWQWWQCLVYSVVLGGFVFWSQRYAVLQSKTQIADYLQNTVALQNMAIIATIEAVFCFGFISCWLQGTYAPGRQPRWWQRLLWWYPSLLLFPVMFFVLTQTLFMAVGVSFDTTSAVLAVVTVVGLPLLAEGACLLLPEADDRVELQVLLTSFVCILGLLSTETGKMVYKVQEAPVDLKAIGLSLVFFALLFLVGFLAAKLKWKFKN